MSELDGNRMETYILSILGVALISAILSGMRYCFLLTILG